MDYTCQSRQCQKFQILISSWLSVDFEIRIKCKSSLIFLSPKLNKILGLKKKKYYCGTNSAEDAIKGAYV